MSHAPPRTGRSAKVVAAAVVVGLLGSGALVWQASSAAFTDTTTNPGNSWDSGKVVLSDDRSGSAMFSVSNMVPGGASGTGSRCIEVEYDGDVAATVKLHAAATTSTLAPYLDFYVERGTGTCAVGNFGTPTVLFGDNDGVLTGGNDTLAEFLTAHSAWNNGIGGWTPSAANTVLPFRFTYTLVDDANAQDKSATGVTFTWEAQNS